MTAGFAVFDPISGEWVLRYGFPYAAEYLGSIFSSDWSVDRNEF